jgi:hypothetical protein
MTAVAARPLLSVSVIVMVCFPFLRKIICLRKVCTPGSAAVKVWFVGSVPVSSELLKWTVPV